jgi:PBP1b-binding outer membrane lipoprotein LpoB
MKKLMIMALGLGLALSGVAAFADDAPKTDAKPTKAKKAKKAKKTDAKTDAPKM